MRIHSLRARRLWVVSGHPTNSRARHLPRNTAWTTLRAAAPRYVAEVNTQTARDARTRPEWPWCAAVMLGALTLYLNTVCPTVYWYDSAEFASAAAVLGIPHPPGYPIYTLLGYL